MAVDADGRTVATGDNMIVAATVRLIEGDTVALVTADGRALRCTAAQLLRVDDLLTDARHQPRTSVVLEASSVSAAETSLDLTNGGGAVMEAGSVAIPVASAMVAESVAVSFSTVDNPGTWTLRLFKRTPVATTEVATFSVGT